MPTVRGDEGDAVRVVLAGGTGSLGRRLADDLAEDGHEVVVLTRSPRDDLPHRQEAWDGSSVGPWAPLLDGAVLVNLAGALVDRRPTPANVELLRRSRVEPTQALVAAAREHRPATWLQMSTLAIHGDAGEQLLDEDAPPADGPPQMAGVAVPWEQAAAGAPCGRQVLLRAAVVLEAGTPALDRLVGVTRAFLGGRIGDGQQWVSWIHVEDFLAAVRFVLDHDELSGPVVLASPGPVRNAELMRVLRDVVGRPWAPPTPAWAVRVGSVLLRTDPALALTGRRAHPRALLDAGFTFGHPTLQGALADLLA